MAEGVMAKGQCLKVLQTRRGYAMWSKHNNVPGRTDTMAERLKTARLIIERQRVRHADLVYESQRHSALYTYIPQEPMTLEALRDRYRFLEAGVSPDGDEHWLNWIAFCEQSRRPVATFQATIPISGQGTIAYSVFPPFWKQGYATELSQSMLTHIFEHYEPTALSAEIDTRNAASIRLVEKLGFTRTAFTADADFFKGTSSDEYRYTLTRQEWLKRA